MQPERGHLRTLQRITELLRLDKTLKITKSNLTCLLDETLDTKRCGPVYLGLIFISFLLLHFISTKVSTVQD